MGTSISHETGIKLDRNRANGRLCAGGVRHCTPPATTLVVTNDDLAGKTMGPMKMCARHARMFPVGFEFANPSTVLRHEPITTPLVVGPTAPMFTVVAGVWPDGL